MAAFAYPEIPSRRPGQAEEEYIEQMRSLGLRQVVRWVPDLSNPGVLDEYRRQLRALAEHQRSHPEELMELNEDDLAGWQ